MSALNRSLRLAPPWIALLVLLVAAAACIDFYDRIPCDTEDDCPYGFRCNGVCEGPGQRCGTDADCDEFEAVKNHRDLLCVRMPWESDHGCRLSCTPGSSARESACPPGQECRSLADSSSTGACF
ncbi:MAG: hypothetical protein ABIJ09_14030 [Pseudomonadota bacterium]